MRRAVWRGAVGLGQVHRPLHGDLTTSPFHVYEHALERYTLAVFYARTSLQIRALDVEI